MRPHSTAVSGLAFVPVPLGPTSRENILLLFIKYEFCVSETQYRSLSIKVGAVLAGLAQLFHCKRMGWPYGLCTAGISALREHPCLWPQRARHHRLRALLEAVSSPGDSQDTPWLKRFLEGKKKSLTKLSSRVTSASEHKECAQMKYMAEKTITDPDCNRSGYLPLNLSKHVQKCIISDISSSSQGLARGETLSFSYRR